MIDVLLLSKKSDITYSTLYNEMDMKRGAGDSENSPNRPLSPSPCRIIRIEEVISNESFKENIPG